MDAKEIERAVKAPLTEEEYRRYYENRFEDFLKMTEDIKESDYATDAELSMINILTAIHEKDYKRAMKLTGKISSWIGVLPWAKNVRPEEELLWGDEYLTWKGYLKKYLRKTNG